MLFRQFCVSALVAASLAVGATAAAAAPVTLTMDEAPIALLDGLVISKGGIDFTFSNPAGTLVYRSAGPGNVTYINDPSVQGPASVFSVTFSTPVDFVQFGMAESIGTALPGVGVLLSNGSNLTLDLTLLDPFAEGQFTYSGSPILGFTVTPVGIGQYALAFDNLTVNPVSGVPEPATIALLGTALGGIALGRRRRKTR